MRKLFGSIAAIALLAPMPATMAQQSNSERIRPAPPQWDLCRRPAALPNLGPEAIAQQQQRPRPERSMASRPSIAAPPSADASGGETTLARRTSPVVSEGAESEGTSSKAESEDRAMPGYMPPRPYPKPQPRPQSGLLTAGEHDDLLNPELYSEYVRNSNVGQAARDVPHVDTERLLTVEVKNRRGQVMPFVPIEVRCANGKSITLKSVADGRSVFFPALDRLEDLFKSVQVTAGGGQLTCHHARARKLSVSL